MLTRQWRAYLLVLPGLLALGCGDDNNTVTKRDASDAVKRDGGAYDAMVPDGANDLASPADAGDLPFPSDGGLESADAAQDGADAPDYSDVAQDGRPDGQVDVRDAGLDRLDAVPIFDTAPVDGARDSALDGTPDISLGQDGRDAVTVDGTAMDGAVANTFVATLSGAEVVPMVRTSGTGSATFELSTNGTALIYQVSLANVGATRVGIYLGAAGENGTQVYPLSPISGSMTGTLSLTPTDAANLAAGLWYLSVQSDAYPNGELRGQILRPNEALWVAQLTSAQAVPPGATSAVGHAALIGNGLRLRYHLSIDGVTPTGVRIQVGVAAQTGGPVAYELTPVSATMDGVLSITATDVQNLQSHHWYVNVLTAGTPTGELRGQVLMPGETLYSASMDGASETPPVTTAATGAAQFILDTTGTALTYEAIFVGLSAAATASHIHTGAVGVAGPVLYPLTLNATGTGVQGTLTVTPTDVTNLGSGAYYINAHTAAHPDGEIRGQITRP